MKNGLMLVSFMELTIGVKMAGLFLLPVSGNQVFELIATPHHNFLTGRKPTYRSHPTATCTGMHLNHGKLAFSDLYEYNVVHTYLYHRGIGYGYHAVRLALCVQVQAAELPGLHPCGDGRWGKEQLASMCCFIRFFSQTPGTLYGNTFTPGGNSCTYFCKRRHCRTVKRCRNFHFLRMAHREHRGTLLSPATLGYTHITHNTISFCANFQNSKVSLLN